MSGAFLWQNAVATSAAQLSNFAITPTMPLSNIVDPQPRVRARLTPLAGAANIAINLGADVTVEAVALISTTLASPVQIYAFGRTGDILTGPIVWDTSVYVDVATSAALNGNVVLLVPVPAVTRHVWVFFDGLSGPLDIGCVVAGPLFRMVRSHAYGIEEGRLVLDRRDRNGFTGAEFPVPSVADPRYAAFTLPALTSAEATGAFRSMAATLGAAGDALWIPDTALTLAERNARSIWGAVAQPGEGLGLRHDTLRTFSRSFKLVERL